MTARWRPLRAGDLDAVMAVAAVVHPAYPERVETFADKLALAPDCCFALESTSGDDPLAGYAIAYPWPARRIAPLDALFGRLPEGADALYVHDVALRPAARGRGAAAAVLDRLVAAARRRGLHRLSLMAVYGAEALWARHGFAIVDDAALRAALTPYGPGARYMERVL